MALLVINIDWSRVIKTEWSRVICVRLRVFVNCVLLVAAHELIHHGDWPAVVPLTCFVVFRRYGILLAEAQEAVDGLLIVIT